MCAGTFTDINGDIATFVRCQPVGAVHTSCTVCGNFMLPTCVDDVVHLSTNVIENLWEHDTLLS